MKVIDTFMFRDELDMLEVRLAELDQVADRFILVESAVTHRGDPKPLHFAENRDRFAPWLDKIVHVVSDLPAGLAPWASEHAQRDGAVLTLRGMSQEPLGLADDDVVLISDVDEFPPQGFDYEGMGTVVSFNQRLAMYAVDWVYPELHCCTVAARWGALRGRSLASVRDNRHAYPMVSGGWHITWLGGVEGQRAKLSVTCHTEMTASEYDRIWSGACYERGVHHGDGGLMMVPADVDETWPQMICERKVPASWFRPR